ncbi:MAG: BAX inhibitor protein [marine bacterium B5-7]|nr:MAG: BAX inhibitor protein [marine bacterium B5-7]
MQIREQTVTPATGLLRTHTVLRNTYLLLGLTLIFSGFTAWFSVKSNAQPGIILFLIGAYGLMFLTNALRNSPWGVLSVFAFTGFMGYTLGPILNMFLHKYLNGAELIMTALGGTGAIFLSLSIYALTTRKDFSFLSNFIFAGFIVLLIAMVAGIFIHMPALQLMISAGFMLFSSAVILFHTGQIIHGGETNYIMATITLYVALYNLFLSLLQLLAAFSGRD